MNALKKIVLVLLAVVLVVAGWVYMAFLGVERTVLSSAYYRTMFSETAIFPEVHAQFQEQMKEGMLEGMAEEHEKMLEEMSEEELFEVPEDMLEEEPAELVGAMVGAFGEAFHVEWMETQALNVIEDVLALAKGQEDELTAVVDLHDGRERLHEELAKEMAGWSPERLEEMDIDPGESEPGVERILEEFELPARIDLAEMIPPEAEENISLIQSIRRYFLFLPYIFFAVIFFLNYQLAGLYSGMKWFGAALLVSGSTFFAGLQIFPTLLAASLTAILEEVPLHPDIIVSVINFTAGRISLVPLIFTAVGLVLLVIAVVLDKKRQKTGVVKEE